MRVGNNPTSDAPAVAGLADGGTVVVWASDNQLLAQRLDATGTRVGEPLFVNDHLPSDPPGPFAIAGLAGGGFVVVWSAPTNFVITPAGLEYTLQSRRYSRDGQSVAVGRVSQTDWHTMGSTLTVSAAPDGGYAVGWSAKPVRTAPLFAYMQRFAADGSLQGPQAGISPIGADQSDLALSVLPNGNVVASWLQASPGSQPPAWSLYTRQFSAASVPLGAEWQVLPPFASASSPFDHAAAALADGNVALVWQAGNPTIGAELRYVIASPAGGAPGGLRSIAWGPEISGVEAVATGSGFAVLWQTLRSHSRGTNAALSSQTFAGDGTALVAAAEVNLRTIFTVSPTSGLTSRSGTGFAASGMEGGHFVAAFLQAGAAGEPPGVHALAR